MYNFKNKNVFIVGSSDKFLRLYLDALCSKTKIDLESIIVFVLPYPNENWHILERIEGVEYLDWNVSYINYLEEVNTITTISLLSYNSSIVKRILNLGTNIRSKFYLFLLDDEFERWLTIINKEGSLKPNDMLRVSEDDIESLKMIDNYICCEKTFKVKLEMITGRKVNILDAAVVFDILPSKQHEQFDALTKKCFSYNNSSSCINILYGSKGIELADVKKIIRLVIDLSKNREKVNVTIITNVAKIIIFIEIIKLFLNKVKGYNITFKYVSDLTPFLYNTLISSCDFFVLQDRGGASSARTFSKLGNGYVCVTKGSHNYCFFEEGYNVRTLSYVDVYELSKLILQVRRDHSLISTNSLAVNKRESESLKVLEMIYDC